jgi:hypothetical protein
VAKRMGRLFFFWGDRLKEGGKRVKDWRAQRRREYPFFNSLKINPFSVFSVVGS